MDTQEPTLTRISKVADAASPGIDHVTLKDCGCGTIEFLLSTDKQSSLPTSINNLRYHLPEFETTVFVLQHICTYVFLD